MKKRESFIFYRSFYETIKEIEDDSERLKIYDCIMEYALNNKKPKQLSIITKSIFMLVKPQIDANYRKYLNGLKGGVPKGIINNINGYNQYKKKPKIKTLEYIINEIKN